MSVAVHQLLTKPQRKHMLRLLRGMKSMPPSTARVLVEKGMAFRSSQGVGYYLTNHGTKVAQAILAETTKAKPFKPEGTP